MSQSPLFSPLQIGKLQLRNRIFMAPMTRSRAVGNVIPEIAAEYYAQRATAGLIISEATQVSPQGIGYINTPGIHSKEQATAWKKVTDAVHKKGGAIFAQLWHVGRVSHPDFHDGKLPVAPSAIAFEGTAYTQNGMQKVGVPRALTLEEIKSTVDDFENAAKRAQEAGFDGVEVHGANGYLIHQFLEDGSNLRTDEYGGTIENRARFLLEITDRAIKVWGAERVSIRLSPRNPFHGMKDSNPDALYTYVVEQLAQRNVAILHVIEHMTAPSDFPRLIPTFRKIFKGILVLNGSYTQEGAEKALARGEGDAVSFGTLFISNPDLPARFAEGAALAPGDRATFYGGTEKGYTDYPSMQD